MLFIRQAREGCGVRTLGRRRKDVEKSGEEDEPWKQCLRASTLKYTNRSFLQTKKYPSTFYSLFTKSPLEGDSRPARKNFPFVFQSQPG